MSEQTATCELYGGPCDGVRLVLNYPLPLTIGFYFSCETHAGQTYAQGVLYSLADDGREDEVIRYYADRGRVIAVVE